MHSHRNIPLNDPRGVQNSIGNYLFRFNLVSYHSIDEVIDECWLRYARAKAKNKTIPNLDAWMRLTGFNIVREWSRIRSKSVPLVQDIQASLKDELTSIEQAETYRSLHEAMSQLSPENQELLHLRFFEGLPWESIAQSMMDRGQAVAAATLRKRAERAIKKLRGLLTIASIQR